MRLSLLPNLVDSMLTIVRQSMDRIGSVVSQVRQSNKKSMLSAPDALYGSTPQRVMLRLTRLDPHVWNTRRS